jgi:hypothetical protein
VYVVFFASISLCNLEPCDGRETILANAVTFYLHRPTTWIQVGCTTDEDLVVQFYSPGTVEPGDRAKDYRSAPIMSSELLDRELSIISRILLASIDDSERGGLPSPKKVHDVTRAQPSCNFGKHSLSDL